MFYKYRYLLVPLVALILCQVIKFIIESIINKELRFDRLFNGSGGMPSSHTTFSVALTTLLFLEHGGSSEYFAISLIFALIVMYDAMGVRYETGKQATVLNNIVDELGLKKKNNLKELKEQIGHKPYEVLGGIVLGILVSFIFYNFIF